MASNNINNYTVFGKVSNVTFIADIAENMINGDVELEANFQFIGHDAREFGWATIKLDSKDHVIIRGPQKKLVEKHRDIFVQLLG